jgi:hypothetical protein
MVMRSIVRRALLACALCGVLLLAGTVGQAVASPCVGAAQQECVPWWHVNTVYAPPVKADGEGTIDVEVSNLGDAPTQGTWIEHLVEALFRDETKGFIDVVEKLPAGLTTTGVQAERPVQAEGGGTVMGRFNERNLTKIVNKFANGGGTVPKLCSVAGQTVNCLYGTPVRPYERIILAINVKRTGDTSVGMNEVSVSGGGVRPVVSRRVLSPAQAASSYGVENYEVTSEEPGGQPTTQAGSHPFQLTTTLALNTQTVPLSIAGIVNGVNEEELGAIVPVVMPFALTKQLSFSLPPGLIGNPEPLPKCKLSVFLQQGRPGQPPCPFNTVVGVATPIVSPQQPHASLPYTISEPLVSLEPNVGEPARFGFQTIAGPVILDTSVRTGGDYGVVVTVPNIIEIPFLGNQVTFWGVPADPRHDLSRSVECIGHTEPQEFGGTELACPAGEKQQPFLIMPTSCTGPWHTSVQAEAWPEPGKPAPVPSAPGEYTSHTGPGGLGEPFGLDGCNRLSFEPSISLTPDGQQASTPTGLTVGVHVDQEASLNPTGLADSTVKDTTVTLPAGVALNPAGADGLSSCSLGQVGLESAMEQSCPESSKVGTVEIETPLLPHRLEGAAFLAQQNANPFGSLVALYLVVKDPFSGVIVKLAGEVLPQEGSGQLVSTFKNTPQLPFENLRLHFFGGSRAPLGTPALCGGYTTTASVAPWSGNPAVDSSSTFQIISGPNHTSCSNPLPFTPELTTGSLNIQAGAFTPFTMTMSREDGNQNLDAIQLKMPPGLLGQISKVKLCDEANANSGTCGPESQIGETTVSVGLGGNPYTVKGGKVYISGPYAGAPYGLSIVNPAKAGPFDLGQVVVRAKIEVNPENAAITITSDATGPYAIPQMIDGIPLQIKHVNVTINRPEFTFNPTNCAPQQIGGALTSSQGAVSALHVPFQVTNCAVLGFKPIFSVTTAGKTSRARGASLNVKLTYPKAPFGTQTNIGKVKVDLPKQLPSRLTTLQKACPDSVFNANPAACPAASRIGTATATTPVLPVHLEGPAFFVSHGGQKFPELIVALSGEGVTVYLHGETFISPKGITSSTFRTIPDVPIGTFELMLPQGPYSALAANGNLCTSKLVMPTTFVGANGMSIKQSTPIKATGCPKKKTKKAGKRKKGKGK